MKRYDNTLAVHDEIMRFERRKDFPRLVYDEIHPTNRCNLNCYFCRYVDNSRHGKNLSKQTILDLLAEMKALGLEKIRLSGGGEPTLSPALPDVIEFIRTHDIELSNITTNGLDLDTTILNSAEIPDWKTIIISLHATDQKIWESITNGPKSGFDRIIENITKLVDMKHRKQLVGPFIILVFGIDMMTYDKIGEAYDLACRLGVDSIVLKTYDGIDYPDKSGRFEKHVLEQIESICISNDKNKQLKNIFFSLHALRLNNKVIDNYIDGNTASSGVNNYNFYDHCVMPWYGTLIRANGDVHPCCVNPSTIANPLGNVHEHSISDIWKGSKYTELRERFKKSMLHNDETDNDDIPEMCQPSSGPDLGCPVKIRISKILDAY